MFRYGQPPKNVTMGLKSGKNYEYRIGAGFGNVNDYDNIWE